jgi:hypothetical protein
VINLEELASYDLKDKDRELIDKEAKRARFRLLRPLSKGHNIVVYISRSLACIEVFRKLTRRLILIDNRIR